MDDRGSNTNFDGKQIDNEVAALLSADMKDEQYYTDQIQYPSHSPRYRGYVEANMEHQRDPKTGPIGLPDLKNQHKKQTLIKGKPVQNKGEKSPLVAGQKSELLYTGDESVVQRPKPANHANMARQRVQQKSSVERIKMEKEHKEMNSYLNSYKREKEVKQSNEMIEKEKDMEMLKNYDPFGKPGGGAPIKTTSGSNLPQLSTDFEIRFRDDEYHKKMVDIGRRYKNDKNYQNEYNHVLERQVKDRKDNEAMTKSVEINQEKETFKYNPFGKAGGGAPRPNDLSHHWSRLEPSTSKSTIDDKRNRLRLQARENMERTELQKSKNRRNKSQDAVYNPWGKGCGNPRYDDRGNVSVRFGMRTHYDVFNRIPIVSTHSGQTLGGWPLPTAQSTAASTGDGLHTTNPQFSPAKEDKQIRSGLLSRRHGENFVTEKHTQKPPMLNGKEAILTDHPKSYQEIEQQKRKTKLVKVQNQSFTMPLSTTDNQTKELQRPSAGTLKRELINDNKALNLRINENYNNLEKNSGNSQVELKPVGSGPVGVAKSANAGNDVADWMRSTTVSQPQRDPASGYIRPTRRTTSDVTRHRLDIRQPINARGYHNDLTRQVLEKTARVQLTNQQEKTDQRNWDRNLMDNFGRPGGGAPSSLGPARRQFGNPSMMPTAQTGTSIPRGVQGNENINSHIGGAGHGAPHDKGPHRRMFSNQALVPSGQKGTQMPRISGNPTGVGSLLKME